jgi:hypothetical protein
MLEHELVDLTEYDLGGRASGRHGRKGWSLVAPVWDSRGRKLLGCLRMESTGGVADDLDLVSEFEEPRVAG